MVVRAQEFLKEEYRYALCAIFSEQILGVCYLFLKYYILDDVTTVTRVRHTLNDDRI